MNILSRLKIRTKLALLLGLSALALIVSIGIASSVMHTRMINDRVNKLTALVQATRGLAVALEAKVTSRQLTREQALAAMRDDIHAMRFDGTTGYLVAQAIDGVTLMHGANPALEGKPTPVDAATGKSIATLVNDALRDTDDSVITYMFPKPGQTQPLLKLSSLAKFPPWQLVFVAGAYIDDLDADFRAELLRLALIGGAVLLVTLLIAWLINRDITGSLGSLRTAMERLATGDLVTAIPATDRGDEVGGMAKTVLIFKEHMETAQRLTAEQAQERDRAEAVKHEALANMADRIEAETGASLEGVAARTSAMTATAREMSASAARTGASAESARTASAQALANAQTVASAAEQLSTSIHEISGQVAQSSQVVARAVAAGSETRATIETLNEQVGRIGAVADIIGEIAARTNLLALNATIEAARAGDAGKGFAVVASEVKALATQTAQSTQQIAQHIGEVRTATGASVAAVVRIEQTIGEIDTIASSIAAAVEQQGAATAEIARNVTETASAANEMTNRTAEVSSEAEQTGQHAVEVSENAAALNTAVEELRHAVIRVVRTSTTEVDRRRYPRHQVNLACRLSVPGQPECAAKITEMSRGGAKLVGAASLQPATRGSMRVDEFGLSLPFTVRASESDGLHVIIEPDEATAGRLTAALERVSMRRAA